MCCYVISGGLGRPPLAHTHSNLPLPNLNMQGSFPSSQSVHPLFNTSPSPHSPSAASARTQPGPNDPGQPATASEGIPPYSHQGPPPPPPPPASLTPVTSTNGNPPPSGGLVVPTPTRQRTIKSYHCRMCDQVSVCQLHYYYISRKPVLLKTNGDVFYIMIILLWFGRSFWPICKVFQRLHSHQ